MMLLLKLLSLSLAWTYSIAFTTPGNEKQYFRFARIISENESDEFFLESNRILTIHRRNVLGFGGALLSIVLGTTWANADDQTSEDVEKLCNDGRILSESQVPGAYQQLCMGLQERQFKLQSSGDIITIRQGANSAGGSSVAGRTGVAVWNSGILLTRVLDEINLRSSIFKDKTVMELGCGVGLASIALAKFGSSSILATDANLEVLGLAKQNFELNDVSTVAETAELRWGLLDASEFEDIADIIVGSDLTYNSGGWMNLSETMETVLKPDGVVIYLTLGHSGFNVQAELGGFLQVAENAGLQILDEEKIVGQGFNNLLERITNTDEKQVISANGGARVVLLGKKTRKRFR